MENTSLTFSSRPVSRKDRMTPRGKKVARNPRTDRGRCTRFGGSNCSWAVFDGERIRVASGAARDALDLPGLPGQGDNVSGRSDELERGRSVQTVRNDSEGAVSVDFHERAGVRLCRRARRGTRHAGSLREGVETMARAKFHVYKEGCTRGHLGCGRRLLPDRERHNLAVT